MQMLSVSVERLKTLSPVPTGIDRANALGLITFVDGGQTRDADYFSHHGQRAFATPALRPCNSRDLCDTAHPYLTRLLDQAQPTVLELGPGAGIAAAQMRHILPDCHLTTMSLTPVDPYFWWHGNSRDTKNAFAGVLRQRPYIDRQYIGDVVAALAKTQDRFDFVYDCFGPVFWELTEAVRQQSYTRAEFLIQSLVQRLNPGGVLYIAASEGEGCLERMLGQKVEKGDQLRLDAPRFKNTEIRICVFEKSN